jgi:signal transduction histidine kinase/DNA-binding response OmpR family regulator/streptogramin lyase
MIANFSYNFFKAQLQTTIIVIIIGCLLFSKEGFGQGKRTQISKFGASLFPNKAFKGICKDYQGFIWVGTDYNGLNRFDGINFESFTDESHGLYNNAVSKIISLPDSMLLLLYSDPINSLSSIEIFDPVKHEIYSLEEYTGKKIPFDVYDKNLQVNENKDGTIWFSNRKFIWEYKDHKFVANFKLPDSYTKGTLAKVSSNNYWIVHTIRQTFHLYYVDINGNILEQHYYKNSSFFDVDDSGEVIFSTPTNIHKKKGLKPKESIPFPTQTPYHLRLYNPYLKQFWCVSKSNRKNIDVFDLEGQLVESISIHQPGFSAPLLSKKTIFYWDLNGNLWFHYKDGLGLLQLIPNKFQRYIHSKNAKNRLYSNINEPLAPNPIRGIIKDQYGNLYINGLKTYFRQKGDSLFTHLSQLEKEQKAIMMGSNGNIWTTSFKGQVSQYDPLTGLVIEHQPDSTFVQLNAPNYGMYWSIYQDKKERIWIGHNGGLAYLDSLTGNQMNFASKISNVVFHFYENEQGIWILTSSGLYLMDYNYKIIAHYHKGGKGGNYLPHNIIVHLYEDTDGSFWLASKGGGLIHWHPKTGAHTSYKINTKGSDNVLYAVYLDEFNSLWLSSNNGLISFNKTNKEMVLYTKENGVTDNEFNTISHYKDEEGVLYFGSLNGVTAFHPKDLLAKKTEAPLTLVSVFKYNNQSQQDSNITVGVLQQKCLNVLPSDREIKLHFALLDFNNPLQTQYAYKIEGLDNDWTYLKKPEVSLAGIPYGDYNLLLKAKGIGKKWIASPLKIKLVVHRPFYFKWWFIIGVTLSLLAFIVFVFRLRLRILRQQKEKLTELVNLKTAKIQEQTEELKSLDKMKSRFFVNISHELRTPLTLILGPLTNLINRKNQSDHSDLLQLQLMKRNGNRLLNLIEEILDLSKIDNKKITLQENHIDLEDFCQWIYSMFESQANLQQINFEFDYQITKGFILKIDKNKVEKILINVLSNAMKFTPKQGKIVFRILKEQHKIKFIVEDTGKGIPAKELPFVFDRFYQSSNNNQSGTGVGLALSNEFATLMQGNLSVTSDIDKGSTFIFTVPYTEGETTQIEEVDKEALAALQALNQELPHNTAQKSRLILIVEDNIDMQIFIQSLLTPQYNVHLETDGKAAQNYLQNNKILPDLILSDIMMPNMNGIELLEWLKSERKTASIPVVMLTAKAEQQSKLNALRIGVDDYLTKPFSPQELLARIENLIRNAQARLEPIEEDSSNQSKEDLAFDILKEEDKAWIKEVERIATKMIEDEELDAAAFAKTVHLSPSSLQRRIKRFTGLTVTLYLREIRLQKALQLLEQGTFSTIVGVSNEVGFKSPYYFSKIYEKRFGKKVVEYFS